MNWVSMKQRWLVKLLQAGQKAEKYEKTQIRRFKE
jgi:hypothetical protein